MEHNTFHKALEIMSESCKGCSHCIKVCPTEALRVVNGKAMLYADWCIDCGECFRVCQNRAIRVIDDDFNEIYNYKRRILLVPVVFYAQFEENIPRRIINQILYELGFSEIYPVEQSVDTLISEINSYIKNSVEKPIISSFCPAVIRLIQVRFPALIDKIMLLIPPLEVTAQYYLRKTQKEGGNLDDLGIFYMTPCIAKIAAIKSPVGGYESPINGVINMDYVYNKVLYAYKNKNYSEPSIVTNEEISSKGAMWPNTGGESACIEGRSLAIDGMSNVIEFLEKLENDEIEEGIDYLELRGCDESCAGGILLQNNRFIINDYLKRRAAEYSRTHKLIDEYKELCSAHIRMDKIEPRSMVKYDRDIDIALKKMEKAQMLKKILPDIDCGACGAPSCEALAADIVRDDASLMNCIFMQKRFEKEGSMNLAEGIDIMEHIWGKERFVNKERATDHYYKDYYENLCKKINNK